MRKVLALILCLIMVLGVLPLTAAAAPASYSDIPSESWVEVTTWEQLVSALETTAPKYIRVAKDIDKKIKKSYDYLLNAGSTSKFAHAYVQGVKVLDLAGHSVRLNNTRVILDDGDRINPAPDVMFEIAANGDMTVIDNKGGGTISMTADYAGTSVVYKNDLYIGYDKKDIFDVYGKLTVNGGFINGGTAKKQYICCCARAENGKRYDGKVTQVIWGRAVTVYDGGTFIANGGRFEGEGSTSGSLRNCCIDLEDGSTAVINDGYFYGDGGANVFRVTSKADLTVNSGEFDTGSYDKIRMPDSKDGRFYIGGFCFNGSDGCIGIPASCLDSTRMYWYQDDKPGQYEKTASEKLVITPKPMSVKIRTDDGSTNPYRYGVGLSSKLTLSNTGLNFDANALAMNGSDYQYYYTYYWYIAPVNAPNDKQYLITYEPAVDLKDLTGIIEIREGLQYTVYCQISAHWYSQHTYHVETKSVNDVRLLILPVISGTFGWVRTPKAGEYAEVTAAIDGSPELYYEWVENNGPDHEVFATTSEPRYKITDSMIGKSISCRVRSKAMSGYLSVSPCTVTLKDNWNQPVCPLYEVASDFKSVKITNLKGDQEYLICVGNYLNLTESDWDKAGLTGSNSGVTLTNAYDTVTHEYVPLKKGMSPILAFRCSATSKTAAGRASGLSVYMNDPVPTDVYLDAETPIYVEVGESVTIDVTYNPVNAAPGLVFLMDSGAGCFTQTLSEDKHQVTLTGVKEGNSNLMFYLNGYPPTQLKFFDVVVYKGEMKPFMTEFKETSVSLTVGDMYQQAPSVYPSYVKASGTWNARNDSGVVSVDEKTGVVTALKPGKDVVEFHYAYTDGMNTIHYSVEVTEAAAGQVDSHIHYFVPTGEVIEGSCLAPEKKLLECECGAVTYEEGEYAGHVADDSFGYDSEQHWQECSGCGSKINVGAHSFDENDVCTACGYNDKHVCSALVKVEGTAPTCTENGFADYYQCPECSRMYFDAAAGSPVENGENLAVPALGHSYGSDGKCSRCGDDLGKKTTPFTDVPEDAYYYDATVWAYNAEPQITDGNGKDKFMPEQICTRGQVVTFLWRSAGQPAPAKTVNPFEDVKESDYFYEPVLWAFYNSTQITDGTDPTHFSPDNPCKNSHILTFIYRAVGEPNKTGEGTWYDDAYNWAKYDAGLLDGTFTGTYDINAYCPRKNVITYLYRYYNMI